MNGLKISALIVMFYAGAAVAQSLPEAKLACQPVNTGAEVIVRIKPDKAFPHMFVGEQIYAVTWVHTEAIRASAQGDEGHLLLNRETLLLSLLKDDKQTNKAKVVAEYKCRKIERAL